MHAWIGFIFSCAMIVVAAAGKSGYQILPGGIGGTPDTEFMFLIGCAGFAAALAMLAPSHTTARLASMWSAGALAAVTIALNLTAFSGGAVKTEEAAIGEPVELDETKDETAATKKPAINVVLKRTVSDKDWAPFEDFEYRIRQFEREMPPQPANSEANPANIPPR